MALNISPTSDLLKVFESLPGYSMLVKPDANDYTLAAITKELSKRLRLDEAELIGQPFPFFTDDLNPGDHNLRSRQAILSSFENVLSTGNEQFIPVIRYDLPDETGKFREQYWKLTNRPVKDNDGKILYIIHSFNEITDKVNAERREERIRIYEREHQLLMKAPILIQIYAGEDHVIEMANEITKHVWQKENIVSRPLSEVFPEWAAQGFQEMIEKVRVSGEPQKVFNTPMIFSNNGVAQTRYFNFAGQAYSDDPSGSDRRVIVFGNEVTSQTLANSQAQLFLYQSQQRFEAAIEAIQGILWTNNAQGEMVGEQRGWASLTGQSREEYEGYGWSRAVHPDDAESSIVAWREAVDENKTFIHQHRVLRKDGTYGIFSIRAIPVLNDDLTIREWVGVHTDITEQKKAELITRESEERFRSLADQSPMIVYIIEAGEKASMSYFNKTWLDYTGQDFEEAIGRGWEGVVHPDDLDNVSGTYAAAYNEKTSYTLSATRIRRHDGIYRWHMFKGNPRFLPNGDFMGYVGVGIDIHEQKLHEEAIIQSESELQAKVAERTAELETKNNLLDNILTNSSNGISVSEMIRDDKGQVIDAMTILANDAAVKFTGLPKDVYLSRSAVSIDPQILSSEYGKTCLNTLETGKPALIQYYLEYTGRWLELTISKMDDEHLIHIFTDVTNIKEAQLTLERTVEELKRSNQNLEDFAYAASHDLKEPVRKIHIFGDRLKTSLGDKMSEEERFTFERMENAAKRMSSLIDDLLSYSQVSIKPREFEEVDLDQLLAQVLSDLDLEIDQNKATINIEKLGTVQGHQRQLQQAFQNLLTNSMKYSKAGVSPVIDISATMVKANETGLPVPTEKQDSKFLKIVVKDNGIGFEQADAERIFNVFTRLHGSGQSRGTGVGLSIVRKVIENHQGYIQAVSSPGNGASFQVLLPISHQ